MSGKRYNLADKKAERKDWLTPPKILEPVRRYFGGQIPLDPATDVDNPTSARFFFTEADDGLVRSWDAPPEWQADTDAVEWGVFVNPPFSDSLRAFLDKIGEQAREGVPIIALLPVNRYEQAYYHEATFAHSPMMCLVCERVHFLHPETRIPQPNNTFASQIVGYNVDRDRFVEAFRDIGCVIQVTCHAHLTQKQIEERQAARRRERAAVRRALKAAADGATAATAKRKGLEGYPGPEPDPKRGQILGFLSEPSPNIGAGDADAALDGFA